MSKITSCIAIAGIFLQVAAGAQEPVKIEVFDTPNDAGGSLTITWPLSTSAQTPEYRIYVATAADGRFQLAATTTAPALKSTEETSRPASSVSGPIGRMAAY